MALQGFRLWARAIAWRKPRCEAIGQRKRRSPAPSSSKASADKELPLLIPLCGGRLRAPAMAAECEALALRKPRCAAIGRLPQSFGAILRRNIVASHKPHAAQGRRPQNRSSAKAPTPPRGFGSGWPPDMAMQDFRSLPRPLPCECIRNGGSRAMALVLWMERAFLGRRKAEIFQQRRQMKRLEELAALHHPADL